MPQTQAVRNSESGPSALKDQPRPRAPRVYGVQLAHLLTGRQREHLSVAVAGTLSAMIHMANGLSNCPHTNGAVARFTRQSLPTVERHVAILTKAGILFTRRVVFGWRGVHHVERGFDLTRLRPLECEGHHPAKMRVTGREDEGAKSLRERKAIRERPLSSEPTRKASSCSFSFSESRTQKRETAERILKRQYPQDASWIAEALALIDERSTTVPATPHYYLSAYRNLAASSADRERVGERIRLKRERKYQNYIAAKEEREWQEEQLAELRGKPCGCGQCHKTADEASRCLCFISGCESGTHYGMCAQIAEFIEQEELDPFEGDVAA